MTLKRILKLVAINGVVVILLFILAEIVIRLLIPEIKLPGTESILLQESVYRDSQGLRKNISGKSMGVIKSTTSYRTWKYHRNSNSKRKILFLGDSVSMGIGIENDSTFCGIVNNTDTSSHIINPSLIGYSVYDYKNIVRKILVDEGNQNEINEVIICWCLNDIYSNEIIQNVPQATEETFFGRMMIFFRNNSYLYQFVKNLFTDRAKDYYLFDLKFYKSDNRTLRKGLKDLDETIDLVKSKKIKLTILMMPYEFQIREVDYHGRNKPQQLLSEFLQFKNVEYYDIAKAFDGNGENISDNYLYGDGIHFSERGHRIVANYILNEILY